MPPKTAENHLATASTLAIQPPTFGLFSMAFPAMNPPQHRCPNRAFHRVLSLGGRVPKQWHFYPPRKPPAKFPKQITLQLHQRGVKIRHKSALKPKLGRAVPFLPAHAVQASLTVKNNPLNFSKLLQTSCHGGSRCDATGTGNFFLFRQP